MLLFYFFFASSVRGNLRPDGTLELEQQPTLPPGPVDVYIRQRSSQDRDWWKALNEVLADQASRGFVGTITKIDRSDESYEKRMEEIRRNTNRASQDG